MVVALNESLDNVGEVLMVGPNTTLALRNRVKLNELRHCENVDKTVDMDLNI